MHIWPRRPQSLKNIVCIVSRYESADISYMSQPATRNKGKPINVLLCELCMIAGWAVSKIPGLDSRNNSRSRVNILRRYLDCLNVCDRVRSFFSELCELVLLINVSGSVDQFCLSSTGGK